MRTRRIKAIPPRLGSLGSAAALFGGLGRKSASAYLGNGEPALADVMADPMILRLMARDGVAVDSLKSLIEDVRARLA